MNKQESHIITGMSRDTAMNQFNPKLAYDAKNIRITARDGNSTLLSVSNERGTKEVEVTARLLGTPIGFSVLNNYLILFTTTNVSEDVDIHNGLDHIYRISFDEVGINGDVVELFSGNLNFSTKSPIETLPLYENESIQKVYWVDGRNQPRVINIVGDPITTNPDVVNFSREIELKHKVSITKRNTGGLFAAGTVQYAFSYYNKFGQESRIFDYTPLYYLSPKERGLQADQTSSCSFLINLKNLDSNFQYVRVYAIVRSSANATPNCRIVGDYPISDVNTPATIGNLTPAGQVSDVQSYRNLYIYDTTDSSLTYLYDFQQPWGGNLEQESFRLELNDDQYLVDISNNIAYKCSSIMDISCYLNTGLYSITPIPNAVGDTAGTLYLGSYSSGTQSREISLIDNGTYGSTVDATALLFVGGENIVASTIAQKDNTLFLGNIKINKPNIGDIVGTNGLTFREFLKSKGSRDQLSKVLIDYEGNSSDSLVNKDNPSKAGFYNYSIDNNRSSQQIKRFKYGEIYRLGLIAQYKDGSWSEAVWIDDIENTVAPILTEDYFCTGGWRYYLKDDWRDSLIEQGFKRIAPVVVYPSLADRNILCQGLLFPTVYNVGDRASNSPFVQSSWFVRQSGDMSPVHNISINGEVQTVLSDEILTGPLVYNKTDGSYAADDEFVGNYSEQFMTDYSILTFHSPDIEFNDSIQQSVFDGLKVRIVGMSLLDSGRVNYYITTKSLGCADASKIVKGGNIGFAFSQGYIINSNLHPGMFMDGAIDLGNDADVVLKSAQDEMYGWCIYPWHRQGSLNNQKPLTTKQSKDGYTRTAELQHKVLGRLSYATSQYTLFDPVYMSTRTPQLFNSDEMSAIKIPSPANSGLPDLVYYGNIDKVLTPNYINLSNKEYINYDRIDFPEKIDNLSSDKTQGYPINFLWFKYIGTDPTRRANRKSMSEKSDVRLMELNGASSTLGTPLQGNSWVIWDNNTWILSESDKFYGKDPVSMKYKSPPHAVIALDYEKGDTGAVQMCIPHSTQRVISDYEYINSVVDYNSKTFWNNGAGARYVTSYEIDYYNGNKRPNPGVFIAELYRDSVSNVSRFGGNTDTALAANVWLKCGEAIDIQGSDSIEFKEGDTYLARYDCVKTLPYTLEDTNGIIDIYSTEIESRVNLDERTDRNRGLTDNTVVTKQNFNLFNHAGYEQDNNFFNYQSIDYDRFKSLNYPNMITWSLEKTLGEEVDKWTSIDLSSTIDLDGDKGEVTSLNVFNNEIYSFQNRGFAQLLFNSRVQIPTSDGQPIEITNGLKMQGKRYISSMIGCTNKWSIQETPSGLYFIDDESNAVYKFSGSLEDISTKCGMKSWFDAHGSFYKWTPDSFENIITFYDKSNSDVYFVAKDWCLVYSEQLGQFVSFMDYDSLPVIAGVKDGMYAFSKSEANTKVWKMFAGEYNSFFGYDKPYWMTFIANDNPIMDKVFNNLEFRADMWEGDTFVPLETFDSLRVWNEHQDTGEVKLTTLSSGIPSNLKKKFNSWRINIPRDSTMGSDGKPLNFGMNRIRNPWAYINLKCSEQLASRHRRLQFTDLLVSYFV